MMNILKGEMLRIYIGLFFLLCIINLNAAELSFPFQIPAHGKGLELSNANIIFSPTAMAFDSQNRPYIINNRNPKTYGKLATIRNGEWIVFPLDDVGGLKERNMHAQGEIVIDDNDCIYIRIGSKLIYSPDLGESFQVLNVKGSLELRTCQSSFSHPPAVCQISEISYVDRAKKKSKEMAWWAQSGKFSIYLPEKNKHGITLGKPLKVSDNCLAAGSGGHSGGTSFAVTIGNYTHFVYAEVPKNVRTGGNPIYIATADRQQRKISKKTFLLIAPPKKTDNHTRPTITADSQGYLHVLSGSHGEPFYYIKSKKPNDITGGWTKPVRLTGRQCYASIVCDKNDSLHTVFREWLPHASLGYSFKDSISNHWTKPKTLVVGSNKKGKYEYGIFYHRLFIDRHSNLYLSFTFFEFKTAKNGDYPEVLIVSEDQGRTWKLADKKFFIRAKLEK